MDVTEIDYQKIADMYGVSKEEVKNIYYDTFEFIRNTINSLDIPSKSDDEIDELKSSFVIPGLGRLYLDKEKAKKEKYGRNNKHKKD